MKNGFNSINEHETENGNENQEKTPSLEELQKQLNILNISIGGINSLIFALLLTLENLFYSRVQFLDAINSTDYSKNMRDTSENSEISARIFLFVTSLFLLINIDTFEDLVNSEEIDEKEITIAKNRITSSILTFVAASISKNNFNL